MLQPRLKGACTDCSDITTMINDVDCKLATSATSLYHNLTLMLNKPVPIDALIKLMHYKRILQYKNVNSDYLSEYTLEMIADRVNLLKYK